MSFFEDDELDPFSMRARLGQHAMIAGPGPQRTPAELPAIDVPEVGTQQSAVSNQPEKAKTSIAGPDVTDVTSQPRAAALHDSPGPVGNMSPTAAIAGPSTSGSAAAPARTSAAIAGPSMSGPTLNQDIEMHRNRRDYMRDTGSGISQIHNPFLRTLARVGDIAGSAFFPNITSMIPGTELHHRGLMRDESNAINADLGEEKERAEMSHTGAETTHLGEEDKKLEHDLQLQPDNPTDKLLHSYVDKDEQQVGVFQKPDNTTYVKQFGPVQQKNTEKEGELPLGDRVGQLNNMLTSRYQVLNPGKALPSQYSLPPNATQKDYDRIDKGLEAEEKARGTKAQQDQANSMRQEMLGLAKQKNDRAVQTAADKKTAPLQQSIDDAQQAHQLAKMGDAGNAEADVDLALSFFKTMRSGGQGIRFTRQEQDLIMGARSSGQDLMATAQKVFGQGQKFTPEQRQHIIQVIDLHAKAAQQAMDRINRGEEVPAGGAPEGTIHYMVGKDSYDIPPEKEAAFKKKFPNAVKQ